MQGGRGDRVGGLALRQGDDDDDDSAYKYTKRKSRWQRLSKTQTKLLLAITVAGIILLVTTGTAPGSGLFLSATNNGGGESYQHMRKLESLFEQVRNKDDVINSVTKIIKETTTTTTTTKTTTTERSVESMKQLKDIFHQWITRLDHDIIHNVHGGIRWPRSHLLPKLPEEGSDDDAHITSYQEALDLSINAIKESREDHDWRERKSKTYKDMLFDPLERTKRMPESLGEKMKWMEEWEQIKASGTPIQGPKVDYRRSIKPDRYHDLELTPELLQEFVKGNVPKATEYPKFQPLKTIMKEWPQDEDYEGPIHASVYRFNYAVKDEVKAALQFRKKRLPFLVYNVEEFDNATAKWTDDYLIEAFDHFNHTSQSGQYVQDYGNEAPNNFFAYYRQREWELNRDGMTPTRLNDLDFATFTEHAKYADHVRLAADQPHFYWSITTSAMEQYSSPDEWSFVTKDLPMLGQWQENLFKWNAHESSGVECRFGERGVTTATHYDEAYNMVALIKGARRLILQPPNQCSKLGIQRHPQAPAKRQSLLNFQHFEYMDNPDMPEKERQWLERAATADTIQVVMSEGEVLFLPGNWFHYIITLQQSAQCNVRSEADYGGEPAHGGHEDVILCRD